MQTVMKSWPCQYKHLLPTVNHGSGRLMIWACLLTTKALSELTHATGQVHHQIGNKIVIKRYKWRCYVHTKLFLFSVILWAFFLNKLHLWAKGSLQSSCVTQQHPINIRIHTRLTESFLQCTRRLCERSLWESSSKHLNLKFFFSFLTLHSFSSFLCQHKELRWKYVIIVVSFF